MRPVFGAFLFLAVVLYAIAEVTLDRPGRGELVPLRWATDPNPARKMQTAGFARLNPGLKVVVDPGLGGDQTKLIVQCATGTGPDIIDIGEASMATLVEAGVLLDLTPYAAEMGFGPDQTYRAIKPALLVEGKQYRFPCNVWANAVIYNKRIFDDHSVPYPKPDWTYEDFIETGKQLFKNPSKSGEAHFAVANWYGLWFVQDLLIGHGARLFSPDGLRSALDSPEAIAAMQLYHDLMFVHRVVPTVAQLAMVSSQGGWGSFGLNLFSSGKAAMMYIGRWFIVQVPNYPQIAGFLGAAPLPRVGGRPSSGVCGSRAAAINKKSPRWREALKFLRYLASQEYNQLIAQDGDSLPPNPRHARTGRDLVNAAVKDPAFHQTFVDAMKRSRPLDLSPFMDAQIIGRWLDEKVGEVENQLMTPEAAMRAIANEVNQTIRLNLERRPDLQRKYEKVTGRPYTKD